MDLSKWFPNLSINRRRLDWYYLNEYLYQNPKYTDSKRVTHYGKTVFSQNVRMVLFMKFLIE